MWDAPSHHSDSLRREIKGASPKHYPFSPYGDTIRTVQGFYLTRCTQDLFEVFRAALGIQAANSGGHEGSDGMSGQRSYAEGRRLSAERLFFARNPKLIRDAKKRHGTVCMVCGFNFARAYGELGAGYIEAHHLDPLSERDSSEWTEQLETSVDQVAVVCANCHRMIHRQRPALTLEQVRAFMDDEDGA